MADEIDPAADFLAREQDVLAEIDEGFEAPIKGKMFDPTVISFQLNGLYNIFVLKPFFTFS